jgi:hypothetical protein
MRARRRRNQIFREAERLGVVVPGLPGYVPVRERQALKWARSDGREDPDWWEIGKEGPQNEKTQMPPQVSMANEDFLDDAIMEFVSVALL